MAQQNTTKNFVSGDLKHIGDSMHVHMVIDLTNLSLDKNRYLTLTPVLSGNNQEKKLPEVLVNGTTRHKAYKRAVALGGNSNPDYYAVIKLDNDNRKQIHYSQVLPYEKWMDSSFLDLQEDFCGCGGYRQETNVDRVGHYVYVETPKPEFNPQLAYIQPEVEKVKTRKENWESFLDFPVNKSDILPNYMNNPTELAKIESLFQAIHSDKNLTVQKIDIIGYASPEGSISHNEQLSKQRAEAFKSYLSSKMAFPSNVYYIKYGGENWEGLEVAVDKSDMADKGAILDIIQNTADVNARKNKIKAYNKGATYRQMLSTIYPKLRKVVSSIQYSVHEFSVEEAKEILKIRPQQLSLDEMYRIADTYQTGSPQFVEVFETAVRMFPEDKVANLNAAAAALSEKDMEKAQRYLGKADKNTPEYLNNMGVLHSLQKNTAEAKKAFDQASARGLDVAKQNTAGIQNIE
jgi:outer membrane protein OmpA-like peptidoglycan-associated protein